ncbi:PepSY domain-containing protein [Olivibacter sitiensis]|uniref:PepSY domain-containing protein n=1 Tax=Olivibacter sitiensis TaxID=376470 RepID=UPI0004870064|nr:PepSY domain-containing protein [Olivibacter sitiensis]
MTLSIWRYSHLALAVSSFLFLTLASVTGVILAFQPLIEKSRPYHVVGFNEMTLAESLPLIRNSYPGVNELIVDANQFTQIKGIDDEGNEIAAYIDPSTGQLLGPVTKESAFFQWVTALHRSLFLHQIGRFFVGLTAFLLLFIALSGIMLVLQRQRGLKRFFSRVVKENFAQYYHVILGRLSLVPILIIALTGSYLSLTYFEIIPNRNVSADVDFDAISSTPERNPVDFPVFKDIRLSEVQTVEFPFSDDPEDYYTLKLKDRVIAVNQITGDILSQEQYPLPVLLSALSLNLHTGRTSALWAIVLAIASCNILFFIYSGFAITWKRRANLVKNKYPAAECRFIILVGSENGSTFRFANAIHRHLLQQGEKSFIGELNVYTVFPKAAYLMVFTSTYGLGEAPSNAANFFRLLEKQPQDHPVRYSVLGFGSRSYKDFCKFAFDVDQLLSQQEWAIPLLDIHTVNDRSPADFGVWAESWAQQSDMPVLVMSEQLSANTECLKAFTVTDKVQLDQSDGTFQVRLRPKGRVKVTSGDLLAIYPENDHRERLYSIGKVEGEIQLSVRLHASGLGSGFLHRLESGEQIRARIVNNPHFHFPKKAGEVVMISNGTGIAPFLGMVSQNAAKRPCHLYCGFRHASSFAIYSDFLASNSHAGRLGQLHVAFSREGEKQYVSDLINRDIDFVLGVLGKGGVLMICGSLSMQKDVLDLLDSVCQKKLGKSISYYQSHDQVLTDCY